MSVPEELLEVAAADATVTEEAGAEAIVGFVDASADEAAIEALPVASAEAESAESSGAVEVPAEAEATATNSLFATDAVAADRLLERLGVGVGIDEDAALLPGSSPPVTAPPEVLPAMGATMLMSITWMVRPLGLLPQDPPLSSVKALAALISPAHRDQVDIGRTGEVDVRIADACLACIPDVERTFGEFEDLA